MTNQEKWIFPSDFDMYKDPHGITPSWNLCPFIWGLFSSIQQAKDKPPDLQTWKRITNWLFFLSLYGLLVYILFLEHVHPTFSQAISSTWNAASFYLHSNIPLPPASGLQLKFHAFINKQCKHLLSCRNLSKLGHQSCCLLLWDLQSPSFLSLLWLSACADNNEFFLCFILPPTSPPPLHQKLPGKDHPVPYDSLAGLAPYNALYIEGTHKCLDLIFHSHTNFLFSARGNTDWRERK